jgi:hypothetical protein
MITEGKGHNFQYRWVIMKALIITMAVLVLFTGVASADQAAQTINTAGSATLKQDTDDSAPGVIESALTVIKVRFNLTFLVDLFGDPEEPDGPQLDGGRGIGNGIKEFVPITDSGSAEVD